MTKEFKLNFTTENSAFETLEAEVVYILRETANRIERAGLGSFCENVRDSNGNVVGRYSHKEIRPTSQG